MDEPDLFDRLRFPPELDAYLRSSNPWWAGKPGPVLPEYRRWAFPVLLRKLENPIAPVVALRGARQVGKTTLQEQLIQHLIQEKGVDPTRVLRIQFDEIRSLKGLKDPILEIVRWFENRVLGKSLNESAHAGRDAFVFLDEVQNLPDWAPQVKALVDHQTVRVLLTGSSALRIEAGRDSLAGRVTTLELGTLLLREVAGIRKLGAIPQALPLDDLQPLTDAEFWRGLADHGNTHREARDAAFKVFSARGGYPLVHKVANAPWAEVSDQLNETVIRRVIRHDLRLGERGRKRDPQLLEEIFRLVCRYAGQAPGQAIYLNELRQVLGANIGWQRVLSYLRFLDGALLLKLVRPLELRLKRTKGNLKLCLLDPGLRASWLEEVVPLDPQGIDDAIHLSDLAGHLAESVVGASLSGLPHLDLSYFPERSTEPEVDFVMTVGERRIPVEVKYRKRVDPHADTLGLRSFVERTHYNAPFGVLVTMRDGVSIPDPRIVPVSLRSFMLLR